MARRLEGVESDDAIQELEEETREVSTLRKIVLEVTRPFWGSRRAVSMDNYYSSPQLFRQLMLKKLYARGTVRCNRRHVPKFLSFSNHELKTLERGAYKYAVCKDDEFALLAATWLDGDQVTLISTADGTKKSTVHRNIGGVSTPFTSMELVNQYNMHMGGVDVLDQIMSRFALAKGHTYKKWHKKLGLSILDMAKSNAYASYLLANPDLRKNERDPHRWFVQQLINGLLTGKCL